MKNKIVLFLFLGIVGMGHSIAQSLTPTVISSSGGYFSNTSGSLSSTVAEMTMVQTFTSTGNFLTQGFQQPEDWFTSVNEEQLADGTISIYPNPSYGKFNITVNSLENGFAQIDLYDFMGQTTFSTQIDIRPGYNAEKIDIGVYANGIYFLKYLFTGDNGKKETKVIKINLIN
jgi:hypothetical protein